MDAPSLLDTAWTVYRRRENYWIDRITKEWSPEKRGALEARQMADLTLWDHAIDFVGPMAIWPDDIHAIADSARQLLDHLRERTAYAAPHAEQAEFSAIRSLVLHIEDASLRAHREAARISLHLERKAA